VALGNTPRKEVNFAVEANRSYAFGILFKDPKGEYLDLKGNQIRLVLADSQRQGSAELVVLDAVHVGKTHGLVQFRFQADDLALEPGSYPYDVTLLPTSGYSAPVLKGYFEVGANVDEDTSNTYTNVNTGSDITVTMNDTDLIELTIERIDGMYSVVDEMIRDFTQTMTHNLAVAHDAVKNAEAAAAQSALHADELRQWLLSVGYPFWQGPKSLYDQIPKPAPNVLYLITEGTMP
jgi:hypothetical protein